CARSYSDYALDYW
nr:immunoglobulin heavy chain junction region [Mus musculus]